LSGAETTADIQTHVISTPLNDQLFSQPLGGEVIKKKYEIFNCIDRNIFIK
jgi:hypothetical protein